MNCNYCSKFLSNPPSSKVPFCDTMVFRVASEDTKSYQELQADRRITGWIFGGEKKQRVELKAPTLSHCRDLIFMNSLIHWFIDSLIDWLIDQLIDWLVHCESAGCGWEAWCGCTSWTLHFSQSDCCALENWVTWSLSFRVLDRAHPALSSVLQMEREKILSLFYQQLPWRARLIMSSGHTTSLRLETVEVLRSACTCRSKVVQKLLHPELYHWGWSGPERIQGCVVLQRSSGESGTALPRSLHLRKLLLLLELIFALSLATSCFLPDLFLVVLVLLYCLFLTLLCLLARNCGRWTAGTSGVSLLCSCGVDRCCLTCVPCAFWIWFIDWSIDWLID